MQDIWQRAQRVIPGGVNSPVRAFKSVGGEPLFMQRGQGPYLWDTQGKRYIDYVGSWGALILGHRHPEVMKNIQDACENGLGFGTVTPIEVEMAERLTQLVPNLEMVRLVTSGTEATMSALRLARAATGRHKVIKFIGGYHGHHDGLLVQGGSGLLSLGIPDSLGVPPSFTEQTLCLPYNDIETVRQAFAQWGPEIAAVIVEPVAANMNCVLPLPDFLPCLRQLCTQQGSLLIFDEVITGFRISAQGAQGVWPVQPDLICLGKIIGGGLPVGAFGGSQAIMRELAPLGGVYQAGTLAGNPITVAAGLATLQVLQTPGTYETLSQTTTQLAQGIQALAHELGIPVQVPHLGGLFGILFTPTQTVSQFAQVQACHLARFKCFFHAMLKQNVYLAPSAFEAGFMSLAHTPAIIDETLSAVEVSLKQARQIPE